MSPATNTCQCTWSLTAELTDVFADFCNAWVVSCCVAPDDASIQLLAAAWQLLQVLDYC
jgi:hypothetical protein